MSVLRDVRFALRALRRFPGFAVTAILSLGFAMGGNTAIFSLANAFLLRPLPVSHPEQLVRVHSNIRGEGYYNLSFSEYIYLRDHNRVFSGMVAYFPTITMALSIRQQAVTVTGEVVSGNYFSMLGVKPVAGRGFLPEEDRTLNTHAVTVLSHRLWQTRFGGRADVVGSSVRINGYPFTIVGVAPKGFQGTFAGISSELWVPLAMSQQVFASSGNVENRDTRLLMGIGRLQPATSLERARANLNGLAGQLARAYPDTNRDRGVTIVRLSGVHPALARMLFDFFAVLMGISAMALLIACTNLANLLLARGSARTREIGIRLALGASRSQLVKQLLTENMLLAIGGGAVGLAISAWTSRLLALFAPVLPFAVQFDFHPDVRVMAFCFIVCLFATLAFGLVPALEASRAQSLLASRRGYAARVFKQRFGKRDFLLIAQLSISLVLLSGAGLLLRSLGNAQSLKSGFDADDVTLASIDVSLLHYDQAKGKLFYRSLLERIESIPGVESVGLARFVPLSGQGDSVDVLTEANASSSEGRGVPVAYNVITAKYFQTLRIPMLQGRGFRERGGKPSGDAAIGEEAVIEEGMVRRFWPGKAASQVLGKRISISGRRGPFLEIIGIVPSAKHSSLAEAPQPFLYLPFPDQYRSEMTLHARTTHGSTSSREMASLATSIRSQVRAIDKDLPLSGVGPMPDRMSFALAPIRIAGTILTIAGVLALILAGVGVYGVASFAAIRRTREVGIRMALGAEAHHVQVSLIGRGMVSVLVGALIGLTIAALAMRLLNPFLVGVSTTDPMTLSAALLVLLGIAFLGNYIPTRQAVRIDPAVALRDE